MCTGTHPYIPAVNTIEARLQFSTPGGVAENVLHYLANSSVTEPMLNELGGFLAGNFNTHSANYSFQVQLDRIVLTDLSAHDGRQIEYTTGLPNPGTTPSRAMPGNVSIVTKLTTAYRGRSFRGRMFHVGIIDGNVNEDQIGTDYRNALESEVADVLSLFGTDGTYELAIVSYCVAHTWRSTAVVTTVQDVATSTIIASQRRRLLGRGA